jgi:hypothetical protein
MTSAEILPQSPSDKGKADMLEDLEKSSNKESAPTEEQSVEVTEEEVRIYMLRSRTRQSI